MLSVKILIKVKNCHEAKELLMADVIEVIRENCVKIK